MFDHVDIVGNAQPDIIDRMEERCCILALFELTDGGQTELVLLLTEGIWGRCCGAGRGRGWQMAFAIDAVYIGGLDWMSTGWGAGRCMRSHEQEMPVQDQTAVSRVSQGVVCLHRRRG